MKMSGADKKNRIRDMDINIGIKKDQREAIAAGAVALKAV